MRRIAIINQKGGVGKTTTSANLGAALARLGKRVLVVDMDPQANLTLYLGSEPTTDRASTYSILSGHSTFADAIVPTATPGLALVPSHIDLSGAELELVSAMGRETILSQAIEVWVRDALAREGREPVDYLLFDCPPSLGLLAINALAAAEEVVITLQTEFFALQGMSKLVEIVQLLQQRLNPRLRITSIVPCLYDSRLKLAREVLGEIRRFFPGQVSRSTIRTNVKLAESPSYGQTIFEYAPESNGARDYLELATEMLEVEAGGRTASRSPQVPDEPGAPDAPPSVESPAPAQPLVEYELPQPPATPLIEAPAAAGPSDSSPR